MQILQLRLHTSRLEELRDFYTGRLGLPLVASDADQFEVRVGSSRLAFRTAVVGDPFYHFAFNIPAGTLPAAKRFLRPRVTLLTENGEDEFDSSLFHSRQVYFLDPAGNIAEFISPNGPDARQPADFEIGHITGISEIGLPTNAFATTAAQLSEDLGVAPLREPGEAFAALGTLEGRFILVSDGRHWFPTATAAEIQPLEALVKTPKAGAYQPPDLPYLIRSVPGPEG